MKWVECVNVQDEQDVDKAFWLENFQENTLEMQTNEVRTS
jgi:hypothetical protein